MNVSQVSVEGSKISFKQWQLAIEAISRCVVILGIFFIPIPGTLGDMVTVGALLSLFSGNYKQKLSYAFSFKSSYFSLALIILLVIGGMRNVAYTANGWHWVWKYSHVLFSTYLLIPLFVNDRWRRAAMYALLAGCFVAVCRAVLYSHHFLTLHGSFATGLGKNPISISIIAAFICFMCLSWAVKEKPLRYLHVGLFVLFSYFIFFINPERTGMLVYVALLGYFCLSYLKPKSAIIALLTLPFLLVGLYFASPIVHTRVHKIVHDARVTTMQSYNTSAGIRLFLFKTGFEQWKKHPIMGYGTGAFKSDKSDYLGKGYQPKSLPQNSFFSQESSYMNMLLQLGIIGFIVFLGWMLAMLFDSRKCKPLEAGFLILLSISFLVASLPAVSFISMQSRVLLGALLGIFLASAISKTSREQSRHDDP